MNYFAYGSNMDAARMKERKINFTSRKFAKLKGYKLAFNKKAYNGDYSYANIIVSEKDFVEGVLYEFQDEEIANLDKVESYPNHYGKTQVTLLDENGNEVIATTYTANQDKVVEGLFPKKEYLEHLLAGKDILSEGYFDKLKQSITFD